jgi:hypothetical protein
VLGDQRVDALEDAIDRFALRERSRSRQRGRYVVGPLDRDLGQIGQQCERREGAIAPLKLERTP